MTLAEIYDGINSRKDMMEYFDRAMDSSYASLRERQRQDSGENLVKTYILELHNPKLAIAPFEAFLDSLKDWGYKVSKMDEDLLYKVTGKEAAFFFDALNPRFFLVHSTSTADLCRDFIENATRRYPLLDKVWFNSDLLESLSYYGDFEAWKSSFNSKKVFSDLEIRNNENLDWEELNLTLKTRNLRERLTQIRASGIFDNILPVTGIRIKKESDDTTFAREDITYTGKFTARGNNFLDHIDVVTEFSRTYSKLVEFIESNCALSFDKEIGLKGQPIVLAFDTIDRNHFRLVMESWFSGTQPFLLWGDVRYESDDYATVDAIDLHIGHQLGFEIGLDWMRIYLPSHSCGNTVTRLLTNLQQHFKSTITVNNQSLRNYLLPKYD